MGTDAICCYLLARNAVHAAMAGRTNCVIANITGNTYTLVPTQLVCTERNKVDLEGHLWKAVLDATSQLHYFNNDLNPLVVP